MSYPFDLVNGPITRMHVYGNNVLFVTHHIVADWRSMGDIATDIKSEYEKLLQLKREGSSLEFEVSNDEDLHFIESTLHRKETNADEARQNLDHWFNYLTSDREDKFQILDYFNLRFNT